MAGVEVLLEVKAAALRLPPRSDPGGVSYLSIHIGRLAPTYWDDYLGALGHLLPCWRVPSEPVASAYYQVLPRLPLFLLLDYRSSRDDDQGLANRYVDLYAHHLLGTHYLFML